MNAKIVERWRSVTGEKAQNVRAIGPMLQIAESSCICIRYCIVSVLVRTLHRMICVYFQQTYEMTLDLALRDVCARYQIQDAALHNANPSIGGILTPQNNSSLGSSFFSQRSNSQSQASFAYPFDKQDDELEACEQEDDPLIRIWPHSNEEAKEPERKRRKMDHHANAHEAEDLDVTAESVQKTLLGLCSQVSSSLMRLRIQESEQKSPSDQAKITINHVRAGRCCLQYLRICPVFFANVISPTV